MAEGARSAGVVGAVGPGRGTGSAVDGVDGRSVDPSDRPAEPRGVARHAAPPAIVTIVLVATAPIWLIHLLLTRVFVAWSTDSAFGILFALGVLVAPLPFAALLAVADCGCARDADLAVRAARTPSELDDARRQRAWATAGVVAGSIGAVGYLLFLIVSIGA